MEQLIAMITGLAIGNPGQAVRETVQMAILGAICGLLAVTFWVTASVGLVLALARSIGILPAVFLASALALVCGLGLLMLIRKRARAARKMRQARADARRLIMTAALAVLPLKGMKTATLIVAGLVALSLLMREQDQPVDDDV